MCVLEIEFRFGAREGFWAALEGLTKTGHEEGNDSGREGESGVRESRCVSRGAGL